MIVKPWYDSLNNRRKEIEVLLKLVPKKDRKKIIKEMESILQTNDNSTYRIGLSGRMVILFETKEINTTEQAKILLLDGNYEYRKDVRKAWLY